MFLPISLIIILIVSLIFIFLANKLHLSEVIGLIVAGLILSIPFFRETVISGNEIFIADLGNLGLFTLMFVSGFEISGNMLSREKKDSLILAASTVTISLILGFVVFTLLGFSKEISLIMGVCFGITAEATKARILLQLKEMKTRIGALLMGTGIINDVFGMIILGLVAFLLASPLSFKEVWILGGILLAFIIGMMVHVFFDRFSKEIKVLEKILLHTLVPFFFVNMGMHFNLNNFNLNWKLFFIVLVISFCGQMAGSFFSKLFIKLSNKQAFLVGLSMNSKGAVELVVAFVALEVGILTKDLYFALVATALVSTVLFQVVAFRISIKEPNIMK